MKLLAAVLCAAAFFVLFPAKKAEAATTAEVTQKVMKYWNSVTANGTKTAYWNKNLVAASLMEQSARGDYQSQVSYSPCHVKAGANHVYANGCTSNNWYGFSQCWGFCIYMGWLTSGAANESADYGTRYYSVPDDFRFQPGDHIRCCLKENGTTATHSVFVYKVENGTVHVIECNLDGGCGIGLRSFPESTARWYVNRLNSGDNSDYLFRPASVLDPSKGTQEWTDTVCHIAGGFTKGEGNSADKASFYLPQTKIKCQNGSSFILDSGSALADFPNGFYLADSFSTKDISGKWEWYQLPREIKQTTAGMTFNLWYYPIEYRITYDLADGKNDPKNPDTYNVLYGVELKTPTKDGYLFMGWTLDGTKVKGINYGCRASFKSADDMLKQLAQRTTGDVTLKANWRPVLPVPLQLRPFEIKDDGDMMSSILQKAQAASSGR